MTPIQLSTTSLVVLCGLMAWTLCMTLNEQAFGGYLPFAILTISPILGYALGRIDND